MGGRWRLVNRKTNIVEVDRSQDFSYRGLYFFPDAFASAPCVQAIIYAASVCLEKLDIWPTGCGCGNCASNIEEAKNAQDIGVVGQS